PLVARKRAIDDGQAVHFGHRIIDNQEIHGLLPLQDLERLGWTLSLTDGIAAVAQRQTDPRPYIRVVIAHEDPRLTGLRAAMFRFPLGIVDRLPRGARQPEIDLGAFTGGTGDPDRSTRLGGKVVHTRQSHA